MTEQCDYDDLPGAVRSYKISKDIVINLIESEPALDQDLQDKINHLWSDALNQDNRQLFDGTVLSVTGISHQRITVCRNAYRYFYAQSKDPALFQSLGVRPLACTGVLRCPDGLIFARRANHVFLDPGRWELAPSGTFDAGAIDDQNNIHAADFLMREMHEELGIEPSQAKAGRILGLFELTEFHSVDLALELDLDLNKNDVGALFAENDNQEYSALAVVPDEKLGSFVKQSNGNFVPLSLQLLELLKLT